MNFLVDEQLPKILADWLSEKGHDTVHVSALLTNTKILDGYLCELSMAESRVVISKDSDFFNTYLIKSQPYKLLYITAGNLRNRPLLDLFRGSFTPLLGLLENANVIELNQHTIRIWF